MSKRIRFFLAALLVAGLVAGCSGAKSTPPAPAAPQPAQPAPAAQPAQPAKPATGVPAGYPADYAKIIDGSKQENALNIYSNMAEYNWKPVIEGFNKLYPWIKVATVDLGSGEVFTRYYNEKASNAKTADLMISGAPDGWIDFAKTRGEAVAYDSPETKNLPKWAVPPYPGLFTVSSDPMLLIYNKKVLPKEMWPTSLANLLELATKNPDKFKGKVTTYNISESFGYNINWAYVRDRGGESAWKTLEGIGPFVKPETSGGPMVDKTISGEDVAGYFVSGITIFPKLATAGEVLGWAYPTDGTPIFLRGMSIPKASKNQNAAKLMVDFILSHDGQVAFGKGGLVPYRSDIKEGEVPRSYADVVKAVGGEQNITYVNYDEKSITGRNDFMTRWNKAFGR